MDGAGNIVETVPEIIPTLIQYNGQSSVNILNEQNEFYLCQITGFMTDTVSLRHVQDGTIIMVGRILSPFVHSFASIISVRLLMVKCGCQN